MAVSRFAVKEVLGRAEQLVAQGWVQGAFATTDDGYVPLHFTDPEAKCFCAGGACRRAADELGYPQSVADGALLELARTIDSPLVAQWNDASDRKQEEVVQAFGSAQRGEVIA